MVAVTSELPPHRVQVRLVGTRLAWYPRDRVPDAARHAFSLTRTWETGEDVEVALVQPGYDDYLLTQIGRAQRA
jgi:hypothetical protein